LDSISIVDPVALAALDDDLEAMAGRLLMEVFEEPDQ